MYKRALIVDDDHATCVLIERVLGNAGIHSLVLTTSAAASAILRQRGFAIDFLDLQMALPDGLELTRLTRDSPYNRMTPVVLLSDDLCPNAMAQGFDVGARFFLYKPEIMRPVTTMGCVVRLAGANQMGVQLGRLVPAESQCLQEFLLSVVPVDA